MTTNYFKERLREKYNINSDLVDLASIFKAHPELNPNEPCVDKNDPFQRVLLHVLIEDEETDLVEFILFKATIKADPNLVDQKSGLTPLCSAINEGYIEIVKYLLKAGADVN
jgi:ankyrin repeat protein